ncbi:MAG TPA: hypothetical protein VIW02_05740, partial [Gammaproteobacteria bacterium]
MPPPSRPRLLLATVAVLAAGLFAAGAGARGPLHQAVFEPPRSLPPGTELLLSGHNLAATPVTLVVRLDDRGSGNYATRASPERRLPPGPFSLRVPLTGLRTPSGRPLDSTALTRLTVFGVPDDGSLRLDATRIELPAALPGSALGWDLGPDDGLLYPGFQPLGPGHPALGGAKVHAVRRPGSDALLSDGLVGVRRLQLPLADGRWRISLWLDDPGEWDAIPHPLARVVRLNGRVVTDRRSDPAGWIAARYLAGRAAEAVLAGDAWALHGRGRGGRVDATLEVRGGRGLTVELDGDGFRATHLAALLAAPQDGTAALAAVERGRAERFAATWSETAPAWPPATGLALQRIPFRQFLRTDTAPLDPDAPLLAAPGSALTVDLLASAAWPDREARLEVTPPEHAGVTLPVALRHGHWRLRRDRDASTLLVADARHLVAGGDPLRLDPRLPRRLVLRVEVPAATPPGHYRGALTLRSRGVATTQPLLLEVLPLQLPGPGLPLGVYLGEAPHLTWFDPLAAARAAQRQCDLDLLRGLGLTALAPPLPLPDARGRDAYQQRLRQLAASGFGLPLLDYATVKQLRYRDGAEATAASLAGAVAAAAAAGLPEPLWAVADEPPTDAEYAAWLQALTATLRAGGPGIRLAGQLNHRRHAALLPLLDVALVN